MLCSSNVFRKLSGFEVKYFNSLYSDVHSAVVFGYSCSYIKPDNKYMWNNNQTWDNMEGNLPKNGKYNIPIKLI